MDVLLNYALFSIDPEQLADITEVKCDQWYVFLCNYDMYCCVTMIFLV